jgi:hypothetical protein
VVRCVQIRLDVVVGAIASYSSAEQTANALQEYVPIISMALYSEAMHDPSGTVACSVGSQTRLDVNVGAVTSDVLASHTVTALQTRSDVAVGCTDWKCPAEQTETERHSRSEVRVDLK